MSTVTEQATAVLEEFRTNLRKIGQATPAAEKFIDDMNALVTAGVGPETALDVLFRALAAVDTKRAEAQA